MSAAEEVESQSGCEEAAGGPGAPTPLSQLEGVGGITKRDIACMVEGGFYTIEAVAYTPKRHLEQVKGISEAKATKFLQEGESIVRITFYTSPTLSDLTKIPKPSPSAFHFAFPRLILFLQIGYLCPSLTFPSKQACPHGLHHGD